MKVWIVKCNRKARGWDWHHDYFDSVGGKNHVGFHSKSAVGQKFIRQSRAGDLVICHQTDKSAIVGVTRMESDGQEDRKGSSRFDLFYVAPPKTGLRIDPPVTVTELRAEGWNPKCLRPGSQGTIFTVSKGDLTRFVSVLPRLRPHLPLSEWLNSWIPVRTRGTEKGRHYWLFLVMHELFPESWETFVRRGIAAHNYSPSTEANDRKAVTFLKNLHAGDVVVSAFRKHRFAGYGELTSEFTTANSPLELRNVRGEMWPFSEQFRCEWKAIPFGHNPCFVTCDDLKDKGFGIDLTVGLPVKQISKATFDAIRSRLDAAGARTYQMRQASGNVQDGDTREKAVKHTTSGGAGFGDYRRNREVEEASVSFVRKMYEREGWVVESVETQNLGYDLLCSRDRAEAHVEVKGVSGDAPRFPITANEVRAASEDDKFRLSVVLNALSANPRYRELTGKEFLKACELTTLQYMATLPA